MSVAEKLPRNHLSRHSCCQLCPLCKFFIIFEDFFRDFVIVLQSLFGGRLEGLHTLLFVSFGGGGVGFKINTAIGNDAEEDAVAIQSKPAKHGFAFHAV